MLPLPCGHEGMGRGAQAVLASRWLPSRATLGPLRTEGGRGGQWTGSYRQLDWEAHEKVMGRSAAPGPRPRRAIKEPKSSLDLSPAHALRPPPSLLLFLSSSSHPPSPLQALPLPRPSPRFPSARAAPCPSPAPPPHSPPSPQTTLPPTSGPHRSLSAHSARLASRIQPG